MKTTKYTDEQGRTYGTNYMLDDIIEAFERKGMNDGSNDALIKELTIQKIEYGRAIMHQLLNHGGQTLQSLKTYREQLDEELEKQILTLKEIKTVEKVIISRIYSLADGKPDSTVLYAEIPMSPNGTTYWTKDATKAYGFELDHPQIIHNAFPEGEEKGANRGGKYAFTQVHIHVDREV